MSKTLNDHHNDGQTDRAKGNGYPMTPASGIRMVTCATTYGCAGGIRVQRVSEKPS